MSNTKVKKKNNQLFVIQKYKHDQQQLPGNFEIEDTDIAQIICLYTYARYSEKEYFEKRADELLENILQFTKTEYTIDNLLKLSHIGCGLIYLLRNGFIVGDENTVLSDFDDKLLYWYITRNFSQSELYGWIHYLRLRIENRKCPNEKKSTNKQTLICLLSLLQNIDHNNDALIEDLTIIHNWKIFFEKTKSLLHLQQSENIYAITNKQFKIDTDWLTVLIVVQIDSVERERNLNIALNFLKKRKNTYINVLEIDSLQKYEEKIHSPYINYQFAKDDNAFFSRAEYLNKLLKETKTSIVCVWDIDMLITEKQIEESIVEIQKGNATMSIPYNSFLYYLSPIDSIKYRINQSQNHLDTCKKNADYYTLHSVRGSFFINKNIYLSIGGENIHFSGWGLEDIERVKRMEILNLPIFYANGSCYHLYHPKKNASGFYNSVWEMNNRNELLKICSMSHNDLHVYLNSNIIEKTISIIKKESNIQTPFSQNYFCLIENYKMAYVSIFKNGVTHLKSIAVYSKTGYYPEDVNEAHELVGFDEANGYLLLVDKMKDFEKQNGSLLKFAVWRDPVERLISNYKYFCLEGVYRRYFELIGLYKDNSFERFMDFVRFELGKSDPLYQDEHIRRQSDYYCSKDVDYIVPLNKLNRFLNEHKIPLVRKSVNKTSVEFELNNSSYIDEIKELYHSDYELIPNY